MEDFAGDACRTVVAQICEAVGFHSMTQSASETLTDILIKFIDEMGFQAHSLAEFSGRTECNVLDVKLAIDHMGVSIPELLRFMQRNELRYAKAEITFPVVKAPRPRTRFGQQEESEPLPPHIPSFLPPFPPRHTYASTPAQTDGKGDARTAKKQKNKQRRQLEGSLLKLHHAEKKRKSSDKFGEEKTEQEEAEAVVDASKVSGKAVSANPALSAAAEINEVLADPDQLKAISSLDPSAGKAAPPPPEGSGVVRPFSISLPSSDTMALKEAGDGGSVRDTDRDRDRKRQKAVKILSTSHDQDGEKPPAGEATARSPANPGDDGDPMQEEE
mmetsp:Transcript_51779/g.122520  ORF Transcript_51779/g.122520 Transcript_51779/m.122520 type:complete len:330 (+) Transcript_51779:136-1125(+)